MRIVVCVKQVPDISLPIELDSKNCTVVLSDTIWILNPFDKQAIEEAVRIVERLGKGEATVVTMGPPRADKALRTCLSQGANHAIRVWDSKMEHSDTYATATVLAQAIKAIGFDLVLCGKQTLDGDTGQVGPAIAEMLGLRLVPGVTKVDFSSDCSYATVQKKLDRGNREIVECPLPALFTIEMGINVPRYASLPDRIAALRADIPAWTPETLGLSPSEIGLMGSRLKLVGVTPPRPRPKKLFTPDSNLTARERLRQVMTGGVKEKKGDLLDGSPKEVASQVVQFLVQEKIIEKPEIAP